MRLPLTAAQAAYYGDAYYRTPPPDLPSLLLKERIVYLGMPLVPAVTELIIAELLYLQYDDPEKPIRIYINSTGTSRYDGEPIGFETEAFAICDTMRYIKPPVHTICIGQAMGMAAMLLSVPGVSRQLTPRHDCPAPNQELCPRAGHRYPNSCQGGSGQ